MSKNTFVTIFLCVAVLIVNLVGPATRVPAVQAQSTNSRADAVVLVNSSSPNYADFQHFIQPYLDHFGVPNTLLDINNTAVTADIGQYALIIVGHRQLDTGGTKLDSAEQEAITAAVSAGTGLVNFDNDLSVGEAPRYPYIESVFHFGYATPPVLSGITFTSAPHYITQNHAPSSSITTGDMALAGIVVPETSTSLAIAGPGSEPFLVSTSYGQGRAVQWGTYEWMSHDVKGPAYDLDDLVWRSLVWAARKPFVMQGMPPFVTFRMDDVNGPLDWIHIANEYGFIPWAGLFPDEIDPSIVTDISGLAAQGKATFGMHAFTTNNFFYFNHAQATNFTDAVVAQNFSQATQWFQNNNIPISKYQVGHYYELGTNVFGGLKNWGVQFVGTMMDPGQAEANAQWAQNGPFRRYQTGSARDLERPVFYADYLNIPNHPELANQFFNCATEYRDIDGYEWHPSPDLQNSVSTGKHWLTRAFNDMQLATLFTHEYDLDDTNMTEWRQIMEGITQEIAGYQPIYVSLDFACQYARAAHNSTISAATYNSWTNQLITDLSGTTDMATKFYVFTGSADQIQQQMVDVPAFNGSTQVTFTPPGALHHILVSPNPATVVAGGSRQFTATGYDIADNPIPNLPFTWQVVNGGGSINLNGLFTAGSNPGTYIDTVVATYSGFQATATMQVTPAVVDHFGFDPIASPVSMSMVFPVTLRALDASGNPVAGYNGQVTLSDTTGTIQPAQASGFTNGVWTGSVAISHATNGVTITASDGVISGTSNAFDVVDTAGVSYTIWADSTMPTNLNVSDGIPIEPGVKFSSSLAGYITGLRFYKGSSNTGMHTGHLWSSTGALLATVTYTSETASGWQQAALDAPISISANTTYVASYFSPTGYFSDTPEGLAAAVINGPIKALANGEDGPNGVYNYGGSGFPTATWAGHSPNYWVDVVFQTSIEPDNTPPSVTSFSPANDATGINTNANISAVFSEALNASTVSGSSFELRDATNELVPAAVTYDSATRTATLDPTSQLASLTPYTAVLKGGSSGIQDLAGNPLAADVNWTFTTAGQVIVDHFSFDVIASPISVGAAFPVTLRALDAGGNPVASYNGTVTLSDTTGTIQPAQVTDFSNGVWTGTVTISQAAVGVTITASDGSASGMSNSFDMVDTAGNSYTIWGDSSTPSNLNLSDGIPIEPGVKFRSSLAGYITGLRFYKGSSNTGPHTGHLWTATGTQLAQIDFTNETASGWQQMTLATPVAIAANTTYVASYFSPTGYFSDTPEDLATAVVNGPLKALANGEDGPNGVYNYGGSGFPTATWVGHSPNYWVDVVFQTSIGPDTTPPSVTSFSPASGATGVSTSANISAVFNEALNASTVNTSAFELRDPANVLVPSVVTYDSATRTVVLNPTASLANTTTYTVVVKGGSSGVQDLAGNPLAADVSWTFTTVGVLDHFGFGTIPSQVFAGTAFPLTLRALDASGNLLASYNGTVTLSDTTGTIQPAQASGFTNGVWTGSVTIGQAASGVTITASDGSVNGTSNAFDVVPITDIPYTIWTNSAMPVLVDVSDGIPIEPGVKFNSSLAGYITGLRFYKGPSNTGTHIGHLWTATGTLLASVTFTGETDSGWQQATFSTPVAITANTTYVASYFSPTGYFSETGDYFATAVVSPPLRALANGEDGPNGVYNYGGSGFPTATWVGHAPNYWVDVVFQTNAGPDTTPPMAISFSPASEATWVSVGTNIHIVFNEALNADTVNTGTFELRDPSNALVPAAVTYDSATRTVVLDPTNELDIQTLYTVVVKGGSNAVQDLAGNSPATDITSTFTTEPAPPYNGPGGPILILYSASNPFSRYYAEILRAEGLNEFLPLDITQVTGADLKNYDVVLLGEMSLTSDQAAMLVNWVNAGGNLIAMRPDVKLNSLMGLTSPTGTLPEGYLLVNTTRAPGQGIVNQTIQYHGMADRRALNGATSVATLYQDASTATTSPAVSINDVGTSGGQAAAFSYDLARSIVYTRQGNPAWAGQDRDGSAPIRSDDLFFGNASFDPQPDWVNLNKVAIPQADEQQRLLANLILFMNSDRKPLPRFWYLPNGEKAAVLLTGDNHFGTGTAPRFDYFIAQSPAGCSLDDWECIRATAYIYPNDPLSNTQAASYQSLGFEIAMHVTTDCANFTPVSLATFYNTQISSFQSTYPGVAPLKSARTHCIVWSDWDSQVKTKLDHAIRMDLDYYYWPGSWAEDRPGFFTGSGMPMRFADINGNILDVYQAVTQMTDESNQTYPYTINSLLDRALGPEGYYGVFNANMHYDYPSGGAEAIIDSAKARGVPVVSAEQVRKWLDGRNNSSFKNLSWNGNTLTFQVDIGPGANGLQVLLPVQAGGGQLDGITINGSPVTYTTQTTKGIEYAAFLAHAGTYQSNYASVNFLPIVVNDSFTTNEDNVLNVTAPGVLSNDSDPNGKTLTAVQVAGPANGSFILNANGSFTYTPNTNFNGTDSFTYRANNGAQDSSVATVTVTVAPVNDAPACQNVSLITDEDATGQVSPSCADVEGSLLTYGIVLQPLHGSAVVTTGKLSYTPAANYNGSDTFTYRASDGVAYSGPANVGVTVRPVNDPPTLSPITDKNVNELSQLSFTATATDTDSASLIYSLSSQPTGASITPTGSFAWTPTEAQGPGSYPFNVCVSDGTASACQPVHVTVAEINTAPILNPIGSQSVDEGSLLTLTASASDADQPANPLTFSLGGTPPAGASINAGTGVFTWTPSEAQGPSVASFNVIVSDGVATDSEVVSVTVREVNTAPVAHPQTLITAENQPLAIQLTASDVDLPANPLTYQATSPAHGTLSGAAPDLVYTPVAKFNGADSFTFTVNDGNLTSPAANVNITVTSVNNAPVAVNDAITTNEDNAITFSVLSNDTDMDGNPLTVSSFTQPAHGGLVKNADNTFTYTPTANYYGSDNFTYQATDGLAISNTATVSLTVVSVIDPPVALADTYSTNENQTLTIATPGVLSNDTNPEGGAMTAVLAQGPAHGTLTLNANGAFTYVPANGYSGTDSFTYEAANGNVYSSPTQVTITVIRLTIFTNGFESGDFSAWSTSSTDQGDLSVTTSAALGGTGYGMQAVIDDRNRIFVVDNSPQAESLYTARFSFDPNSITMSRGNAHLIFTAKNSTGLNVAFIELRYYGAYQVRTGLINDGTTTIMSNWYTITNAPHVFEITWTASSAVGGNNGSLLMWVDGTRTANLTGIDNDTRRIDQAVLGAVSDVDNGTRGRYFFDEFSSHR